jgi:hypothetical protein
MAYWAFFSYARADDRVANWLHRQLDSYRTPKALVGSAGALGPAPAKLHPIFRDRTDLQAGGHIDHALQQVLEESETLVVLCTPTSAKSHWVDHECETFLRLGRADRIFPVIASGQPESNDRDTECFPPSLRGKGLLAADLREIKLPNGQLVGDGREGGRLKLIAGLLGVPLDALAQRERRRASSQTATPPKHATRCFGSSRLRAGRGTSRAITRPRRVMRSPACVWSLRMRISTGLCSPAPCMKPAKANRRSYTNPV